MNKCRLCNSTGLEKRLTLENAPRSIQRLLPLERIEFDSPTTVTVYECGNCGLVQLTGNLEDEYYDDYVMTVSHVPTMVEYQRVQAFDFVSKYHLAGKKVIEIGCGDGNYMQYLRDAGADVTGIEPSKPFRKMAELLGFKIFQGCAEKKRAIPNGPYDAAVARQVLEHVPNPNDFLQTIYQNLKEGGVALLEVPCLEKALKDGRFYDFFPDHLSYFSTATLSYALERNNLEILETSRGMVEEFNVAIVRKTVKSCETNKEPAGTSSAVKYLTAHLDAAASFIPQPATRNPYPAFGSMQKIVREIKKELNEFLNSFTNQGKRVAVWGAGGKGLTILAVSDLNGVAYIVDSDPLKHGLLTPVSHLPVYPLDKLNTDPVDAVIVTAMAYEDEILSQLKDDMQFRGTIALLGKSLKIIRPSTT